MLSRVAESLFWFSRFVERADNTARILDEYFFAMLDTDTPTESTLSLWEPILEICGDLEGFTQRCPSPQTADVIQHLTFDLENENSILSCISKARMNAHTVRDQISNEMWEIINLAFHQLNNTNPVYNEDSIAQLYTSIKDASLRLQGLTQATYPHGEGYHFIQLGKYMERASGTLRILDLKYHILLPRGSTDVGGAIDVAQWVSILKSCSALEAYNSMHLGEIDSAKIVEMLVLSDKFPRSLLWCLKSLDRYLRNISGTAEGCFSNDAEKLCGRFLSEVSYNTVEDIFKKGLHQYIETSSQSLQKLSESLFQKYMLIAPIDLVAEIQQQQQQQQ